MDERLSSEDLIVQFVMPRLESIDRKLDGKADVIVVSALDSRVTELERHGSQGAKALADRVDSIHKRLGLTAPLETSVKQGARIDSLEAWRNRLVGAVAVLGPLVLAGTGYVLSRIFG